MVVVVCTRMCMLLACFSKKCYQRALATVSVDSIHSDISFASIESAPTVHMQLENKLLYTKN